LRFATTVWRLRFSSLFNLIACDTHPELD
jgi:hypothetical protein